MTLPKKQTSSVSALDEIRWAKENLASGGKRGAPSEFAVLIRDRMLESKEFLDKFVFTFYPKLLPKDAGNGETVESLDGKETVDIIGKLLAIRAEAES